MIFHQKINLFTAVKYYCILHGRLYVMNDCKHSGSSASFDITSWISSSGHCYDFALFCTMCDSLLACFHTYIGQFRQLYKYLSLSRQIMHTGHNTQWKAVLQ